MWSRTYTLLYQRIITCMLNLTDMLLQYHRTSVCYQSLLVVKGKITALVCHVWK